MGLLELIRRPQINSEKEFIKMLSLCSEYAYMHTHDLDVNLTDDQEKYFINASEDIDRIIFDYDILKHGHDPFCWDYYSPRHTGLPVIIQVGCKPEKGIPRIIAIGKRSRSTTISISEAPEALEGSASALTTEELDSVKVWVKENRQILLDYWAGEFDTCGFCEKMGWLSEKD